MGFSAEVPSNQKWLSRLHEIILSCRRNGIDSALSKVNPQRSDITQPNITNTKVGNYYKQ